MLRFALLSFGVAAALSAPCGCAPAPSDVDCELPAAEPKIEGLYGPYARGSWDAVTIRAKAPFTIESSDPSVVRVERIESDESRYSQVSLFFHGEGSATLTLRDEGGVARETVEVREHDTFGIVLSNPLSIPLGSLSEQTILAGVQEILLIYLDSQDRRLYGHGLAELSLSPGMLRCEGLFTSIERHCLSIEEPGEHLLEVTVGNELQSYPFTAVAESEIVRIEILQPDEDELEPGTSVQVDVVGFTEDGTRVSALHPRFTADEIPYFGYFAYELDPEASSKLLKVEVEQLGITEYTRFRGLASDETSFSWDCASVAPGTGNPVPALLSLLALMLLIRLGFRLNQGSRD